MEKWSAEASVIAIDPKVWESASVVAYNTYIVIAKALDIQNEHLAKISASLEAIKNRGSVSNNTEGK